ncbi:sensor domain-containing protein [Mycobacterium sp.]|uniref:sensor domain-containing protein n=1 Tax=Mycobacterium sp. TaxID=1785 RepID=UPI003BAA33E0
MVSHFSITMAAAPRKAPMSERVSAIRRAVAILGCCVAMSACGATRTEPVSSGSIDSLTVSVDDVRRIAGFDGLWSKPGSEQRSPRHFDSDAPAPCRAVFGRAVAFGSDWAQFRSVTYDGTTNTGPGQLHLMAVVGQAVGIYPSEHAARNAFDRLIPPLTACSKLNVKHYDFTINNLDSSTVALNSDLWNVMYRVQSSVLIDVSVLGIQNSEQTAHNVLGAISDRLG